MHKTHQELTEKFKNFNIINIMCIYVKPHFRLNISMYVSMNMNVLVLFQNKNKSFHVVLEILIGKWN